MTLPFENDTHSIIKKIARSDLSKNKTKTVFSIITIALATTLLMTLVIFASGYEISKDRLAAGQPHVIFSQISSQQVKSLQSDEHIESITINKTKNGYDVLGTILDAPKMTQYGFSTAVSHIAAKYNINHTIKNDLFIDSLPDGGLLNQKNMIIVGIAISVIIVSVLVIYNVFYLAVANQVQQFGQFRTIGMTQKQIKRLIKHESKLLCRIGIPIGVFIGGIIGYLLQPDGWNWGYSFIFAIIIKLLITWAVKISLSKPIKVASSISPIRASKYMNSIWSYNAPHKIKRKLSPFGLSIIIIKANWKKIAISVFSLGLSGLLFTLAATYTTSIDAEAIVKKDVYQYGQFVLETKGEYNKELQNLHAIIQNISSISGVNDMKHIIKTDIEWSASNNSGEDPLSIIKTNDFNSIQSFICDGDVDYQTMVKSNQILVVSGLDNIFIGDTVEFTFEDGTKQIYTVGGILDDEIYTSSAIYGGWFLLPEELIPKDSGIFTSNIKLVVSAAASNLKNVESSLESLISNYDHLTMNTIQDAITTKNNTIKQVSISVIGVTLFLLLFSIITFTSTIITNIATRKREYAMLQSIGMDRKQVELMELGESFLLAVGSLFITLFFGIILGRLMINIMISMGVFYLSYTFPLGLFIMYSLIITLIILIITFSVFRTLQKDSLVDRLRETV